MSSELRYQPPSSVVADIPEQEVTGPLNPWFSMWLRPRATIQQIVDTNPNRMIILLAILIGWTQALDRASSQNMGDRMSLSTILATVVVVGPLIGLMAVYLYGWLIQRTGRLIGGKATLEHVRAAVAWGNVPGLWTSLTWIPALIVLKGEMFTADTPLVDSSMFHLLVLLGVAMATIVGAVWSVVAMCKALGQVQGFSAWKALGNIVLAAVAVVVPLALIIFGAASIA
jgi:hypothetical protein